ncbi:hypothetical protein CANARDRAFT_202184 [[Candida] arabinofermentans NRRL YB-2248]|uniref:Vacuolar protein sorting-associated protein 35 n=1 Tax=[Candida] arabinofermentans NRRL YB-2248 TaxID=983967 RepID=A0A1E4SWL4_9ASCO|nr:hypothetical protein CANARDRAFT_202184 [[Candida] arabinofermentans NRRL YB-2248]
MVAKNTVLTSDEQLKQLDNSLVVIRQQIAAMKKCLDTKNGFMIALKHASTFLGELRTNVLTPKQYYELYIMVYDGLEYLSTFLKDNHPNNHLADLYELVQYAGNIIPRLYLMITVGTVYMSIPDAPVKEIMNDMMEMSRGVQHPIRGLFLRYYLSQRTKDLLPTEFHDNNNNTTSLTGDLTDSIHFITTNFVEMNKLWVRLQHQGHSSERMKRINERKELQILVGSNLVRLSQLENIDKIYYKTKILPTLLEQIIQCRDVIAQEYLLDVIIQVFPDEFHLSSLDDFFNATLSLNEEVSLKKVLMTLINRLIDYKQRESTGDFEKNFKNLTLENVFDRFIEFINKINELKPDLSSEDYSSILEGICKLSIAYYPNNYDNINCIYKYAIDKFNEVENNDNNLKIERHWKLLLLVPIDGYDDIKLFLKLDENYLKFFNLQKTSLKRTISLEIIDKFIENEVKLDNCEEVEKIFEILKSIILIQDDLTIKKMGLKGSKYGESALFGSDSAIAEDTIDSIEIVLQQEKLAKFLHLISNKNPYKCFELLCQVKKYLQLGKSKIKYTYPTLISIVLKLIRKLNLIHKIETKQQKIKVSNFFKFISLLINEINELSNQPSLTLNLNLITAQLADEIKLIDISYDFFIESFMLYEQSIIDSRLQYQTLITIISKLIESKNMIELNIDNFNQLITKATLYGSKLLKKTDQCRAVFLASHLWWIIKEVDDDSTTTMTTMTQISLKKDEKRVLECLQKALRVADNILDVSVSLELFIEILNQSVYYFIHGNDIINVKYLNGLIELISNNFKTAGEESGTSSGTGTGTPLEVTYKHFDRTINYIKEQRGIDERFQQIKLS